MKKIIILSYALTFGLRTHETFLNLDNFSGKIRPIPYLFAFRLVNAQTFGVHYQGFLGVRIF